MLGNHGLFRIGQSLGRPLLLDMVSAVPAVAYSLRKIRSGYLQNCIRVRRSSDNAELDIGFVNGELDITTLLSFAGAGNCYITTWYDQSMNANHALQTTASNQPWIVNSGVLITQEGLPAIEFKIGGQASLNISSISATSDFSHFVVMNRPTAALDLVSLSNTSSSLPFTTYLYRNGKTYISNSTSYREHSATPSATTRKIFSQFNISSVLSLYENAQSKSFPAAVAGGGASTFNVIGQRQSEFSTGFIQEMIMYSTNVLTDRVTIEDNINQYFQVY